MILSVFFFIIAKSSFMNCVGYKVDLYINHCMDNNLIPVNVKGKASNLDFAVISATIDNARHSYMRSVKRMLNPGIWHDLAGWASASFKLFDPKGEELYRLALEGDYIRIDIPGPGPARGGGYDWVRIEKIEEYIDSSGEREWTGMKVRPSRSPGSMAGGTAHFFRSDATSTFIIELNSNKVTAFYHGRNEVPNTSTGKTGDNVRNALVAAGAIVSLSEAQWSALCKGFLADEIGGKPLFSAALPFLFCFT
jgi:hypothetical protein